MTSTEDAIDSLPPRERAVLDQLARGWETDPAGALIRALLLAERLRRAAQAGDKIIVQPPRIGLITLIRRRLSPNHYEIFAARKGPTFL